MLKLAVLGHPVAHSRSPAMQNAALEELGLAGEWSYEAIDVEPTQLAERLAAMPAEGFVGANVTVPHKEAALALADTASDRAAAIGAANTLSFEAGQLVAENTDASGFLAALPGGAKAGRALVLGAGGAARAIVWALVNEGTEVEIWNRTAARAEDLARRFGAGVCERPADAAAACSLIVNATTVGMNGKGGLDELGLEEALLRPEQQIVEIVYGEETELMAAAARRGCTVVSGAEMLVRQGAESLRIWTAEEPPLEAMRRAIA